MGIGFGTLYGTVSTFFSELQNNRKSLPTFTRQKKRGLVPYSGPKFMTIFDVAKMRQNDDVTGGPKPMPIYNITKL